MKKHEVGDIVSIPASVELMWPTISDPFKYKLTLKPEIGWVTDYDNEYDRISVLTVDNIIWQTFTCNVYPYKGEQDGSSY